MGVLSAAMQLEKCMFRPDESLLMHRCDTCVVHLVWKPLGLSPFKRFLESYRIRASGWPHRLLITYNGFEPQDHLADYERLLDGVQHSTLRLTKPLQDIPAYFASAESCSEKYLMFVNSFSEFLHAGWLAMLHRHLSARGKVGIVGATGSAESHLYLSARLEQTRRLLCDRSVDARAKLRGLASLISAWQAYGPFPNYHLRTNAFLVTRELFLTASVRGKAVATKQAAQMFESGRRGFTARLLRQGYSVGVVGKDGECHLPSAWSNSRTFRSGGQENLLIADNRTRQYEAADTTTRRLLAEAAWGKAAVG